MLSLCGLSTSLRSLAPVALLACILAPDAPAQQVQWKLNPLTNKYVGLTFGTSGWNAAQAQAVAYGGNLVTIRSAAENQWLINNFASVWGGQGFNGSWHGLTDAGTEGQWRWISGEPLTYTAWAASEPNGFNGENWAFFSNLLTTAKWADGPDGFALRSLIEVGQLPPRSWSWPNNYQADINSGIGCTFDMDGDGDLDYASPSTITGEIAIFRNINQGVFAQAITISGCSGMTLASEDWDGDGDQDLLAVHPNCNTVRLLTNLNNGTAWGTENLAPVSHPYGLALGDVNNDGATDLVVTSSNSAPGMGTSVFLRLSNGSLSDPSKYGDPAFQPTLADLNKDGNLDLITSGWGGVRLFLGSSDAVLSDLGWLGSGSGVYKCTVADFDKDGTFEILVPRESPPILEIWKSNGSPVIATAKYSVSQSFYANGSCRWVETEDLDGDGDLDVVLPSWQSSEIHLFNNQSGTLTVDHVLAQAFGSGPVCSQVDDLNGDAKPDIITSNSSSNTFSIHLNQSIFDCNANGIDDPLDLASGVALDCNGNGRPDSCDIAFGISQDSDGDGIPNECEPTLVGIQPAVRAAALAGTVAVQALNIPAGAATLSLSGPALAAPVAVPITLVAGAGNQVSAQVALPSLFTIEAKGFAGDVVLSGTISWTDGLGAQQTTGVTPGVFTFDVPEVVTVQPSSVPFDGPNSVLIELDDNVIQQGIGAVRFGAQPAVFGNWLQIAGKTYVSAIAPPQPAPGDYPIELEITAGGVKEITRVESRALIHLGPGIQSLSQISGFQGGGEPLTFALVGFQPGVPVQVAFGSVSVSASPVGFLAASTLTVLTPLSPVAGVVDLTLTQVLGPGQVKTAVSPAAFEFIPPGVGALSQTSGPQAGGQALSVTTDGFAAGPITVRLGTTVTQGSVQGSGANQTVSWTSVASPVAGPVDLTLVQGVFTVTKPAAYTFNAPQLLSVTPNQGSWYQPQTVQIQGQNFAPNLPVSVRFTGESPIAGVVQSSSSIQVSLPAGFLKGAGPLGLIVSQASINASLPAAFLCLPALTTSLTGSAALGGQLRYQVQSQQSGFAIALLSAGLSPLPLTLPDIHAGFSLDFATSFNLGSGGLFVTPTVQVNFPPLSVPPGTTLQAQALALEFGPLGTWYSFTNTVPVLLP